MRTTVLFLTILALTSFASSQKAFDQVKNLLVNFQADIVKEQSDADVRNTSDSADCTSKISDGVKLVSDRQKDVDDLTTHISWLSNEQTESQKDKQSRADRIVANNQLLDDFKKQRCDNNLLFVKQLREHMEAIDIMILLKQDINQYFVSKSSNVNGAFIERFSEFSHLLSNEKRQVFTQLASSVKQLPDVTALTDKTNANTSTIAGQIGTGHVDNSQGELKALATNSYDDSNTFNAATNVKIIAMIDGLVAHLKESRDNLTKNEIKASEDFALFQSNMEKENIHLQEKIDELIKTIADLTNQINVANAQLVKRQALLEDAKTTLSTYRRICKEKSDYYNNETARRTTELTTVGQATTIFNNVLANLSARVIDRANQDKAGLTLGNNLSAAVNTDNDALNQGLTDNVSTRKAVVF